MGRGNSHHIRRPEVNIAGQRRDAVHRRAPARAHGQNRRRVSF